MEGITISTENKKNSKIIVTILLAILAIYLIITVIFSFISLPNTFVNGKDVSYASKASILADNGKDLNLSIKGRDERELVFNSSEIDYLAEIPKNASIDQNPFSWPIAFVNNEKENFDFEYDVKYDDAKLEDIIKSSKLMQDIKEPQDARIDYDGGKFNLIKEVEGNKLDFVKLKEAIVKSLYSRQEELILDDSYYIEPNLRADDKALKDELEDANKVEKLSYDFNINGYDDKLEGDTLISMFDFDSKNATMELNYDKIYSYVSEIADKTNTYGKNRQFNATGIGEITVNPGVYGFILDVESTVDNIYALVNERKSGTIEPEYTRRGFTREADGTDIGNTYLEVDLSRQYMWYYQDGSLIFESNLVSGNLSEGALTNVGVGSILSKERNTTLKGQNFDGLSEYETPVDYWMPIGWDGEGFHDAPWRSSFGGYIYQTNGSHGCLNMPPSIARRIFEEVDFTTPVIVYESSTNYSPAMSY